MRTLRWAAVAAATMLLEAGPLACSKTPTLAAPVAPECGASPAAERARSGAEGGEAPAAAPPAGYVEVHVVAIAPTPDGDAVLLADAAEQVVLPIFIGGTEALSIFLRFEARDAERPLAHDLFDALLGEVEGRLLRAQVDAMRDGVFVGSVYVRHVDRLIMLDARPSDAIALALGSHAPIFVAGDVMARAGMRDPDGGAAPASPDPPPGGSHPL